MRVNGALWVIITETLQKSLRFWRPRFFFLDFTRWVLQWTHPHPRRRRSVPFGRGVCGCGSGFKASLRHSVGLEDLGQGGGKDCITIKCNYGTPSNSITSFWSGPSRPKATSMYLHTYIFLRTVFIIYHLHQKETVTLHQVKVHRPSCEDICNVNIQKASLLLNNNSSSPLSSVEISRA